MTNLAGIFRHATSKCIRNFKLTWAAASGDNQTVRAILAAGTNVHTGDDHALLAAVGSFCRRKREGVAAEERIDSIRALLEAGADVHARKDKALRMAVHFGRTDAVKMLLEAGADIRALNWWQLRRLARFQERDELVKKLTGGNVEETRAPRDRRPNELTL